MYFDDPLILERYRNPRHQGKFVGSTHTADGDNPFCGDFIELYLELQGHGQDAIIARAAFEGYACSLCIASTDLLLERITGMSVAQALSIDLDDLLSYWGDAEKCRNNHCMPSSGQFASESDKQAVSGASLELGRTRRGCVELPLRVLERALA